MSAFPKDPRPASFFERYHRRARKRVPWMQTLLLAALFPLLALISRLQVRGREWIPDGGYIVAANHPSTLDAVFVALAIRRRVRFMGKSDLFTKRSGRWLSRLGAFPVRRGVWDTDAFQTAEKVIERKRVMAIFPGGGIDPPGGYRGARPGVGYIAHRTGATVVPVHLDGTRRMYQPWKWPKVKVIIGSPIQVERDDSPSRERCQATADQILETIKTLA